MRISNFTNKFGQHKKPGSLKWKFKTDGIIDSSPAVSPDGTIYVGSSDYFLYAIRKDGALK